MQGSHRRLGLVGMVLAMMAAVACLATLPAAAATAPTATTGGATGVTATKATLHGTVSTQGQETAWQFQYGTTQNYDKGTPIQVIPAGKGSVNVAWTVLRLDPDTTYHYRLAVTAGSSGTYYYYPYLNGNLGSDQTFQTKPKGHLRLQRRFLFVRNVAGTQKVFVGLRCQSELTCFGRFTINTWARIARSDRVTSIGCATRFYRIQPFHKATIKARMHAACLAKLMSDRGHRITGRFSSEPRTGQFGLIRSIKLILAG